MLLSYLFKTKIRYSLQLDRSLKLSFKIIIEKKKFQSKKFIKVKQITIKKVKIKFEVKYRGMKLKNKFN